MQREENKKKIRIHKEPQAGNLQKASSYSKDEVYTLIADLYTLSKMFATDFYCHKNCYSNYFGKWHRATSTLNIPTRTSNTKTGIFKNYFPFIKPIIDQGRGFSLSDIKDMINQNDNADLKKMKSRAS